MNNIKTYRDLLDYLKTCSNEQLNQNLACELLFSNECFSSVEHDFALDVAGPNNDFLDDNHLVFTLMY